VLRQLLLLLLWWLADTWTASLPAPTPPLVPLPHTGSLVTALPFAGAAKTW
jgi:hypothetical protein